MMSQENSSLYAELESRLRFETLIADLSSKFVNLPAGEVDREIMDAERRICELLDIDISAVWQWSAGPPGHFTLSHYYSAQDGPQPSMQLSDTDCTSERSSGSGEGSMSHTSPRRFRMP
jgi:hypothetical protein